MLVLMAVQVGGEFIVVYPSAPTEGPTLDGDGDGWVTAVVEEEEIALLLSEPVGVANEDDDVDAVDDGVANSVDDTVDDDVEEDNDANKEDEGVEEEDETVKEEDNDVGEDNGDAREEDEVVEAMPMNRAPRIPPLLTAPPRVFFK
jgi:hypothetical protein